MDARKLVFLLLLVPTVSAVDIGSPPTLSCETVFAPISTGVGTLITGTDVSSTGQVVVVDTSDSVPYTASRMTKLDANCNFIWSFTTGGTLAVPDFLGCTGVNGANNFCNIDGVSFDARNDIVAIVETTSTSASPVQRWKLCRFDGGTGGLDGCSATFNTIAGMSNIGLDNNGKRAIDSIRVSDTEVAYIFGNGAQIVRFNDALEFEYANGAPGTVMAIRADEQPNVAYIVTTTGTFRRVNQDTGAVLHTAALSDPGTGLDVEEAPQRSATGAFFMASGPTFTYGKMNKDTFATITAITATSPDEFTGNPPSDSVAQGFDVDGADDMLVCGFFDTDVLADGRGFLAHVDSSAGGVAPVIWGDEFSVDGNALETGLGTDMLCDLDYIDGAWVGYAVRVGGVTNPWVRHYANTDFNQPIPPALVTESEGGPGSSQGPAIVRLIQSRTADAWGISAAAAGWVVGAIFFGFAIYHLGKRAPLVTATMILLITTVLVYVELWPWWILLLEAFLVVVFAGVALFEKGDAGSE